MIEVQNRRNTTEEMFYTVEEVARMLKVGKMTIYRMVERDDIAAIRVGHLIRVPIEAFEYYLEHRGVARPS